MAFFPPKSGLGRYRHAKTRKDTLCFICGDIITKGNFRYAQGQISLCEQCADCWEKEGGYLGNISRCREKILSRK